MHEVCYSTQKLFHFTILSFPTSSPVNIDIKYQINSFQNWISTSAWRKTHLSYWSLSANGFTSYELHIPHSWPNDEFNTIIVMITVLAIITTTIRQIIASARPLVPNITYTLNIHKFCNAVSSHYCIPLPLRPCGFDASDNIAGHGRTACSVC
jgi:hypothetical protein